MGTDKYHIQVSHHLRVGKNALNEYDQYAIYLAILYTVWYAYIHYEITWSHAHKLTSVKNAENNVDF